MNPGAHLGPYRIVDRLGAGGMGEVYFTFEASNNWPVWSPDRARVFYASNRAGTQWDIFAKRADGSWSEEKIVNRPWTQIPRVISPDGSRLVFTETDPNRSRRKTFIRWRR